MTHSRTAGGNKPQRLRASSRHARVQRRHKAPGACCGLPASRARCFEAWAGSGASRHGQARHCPLVFLASLWGGSAASSQPRGAPGLGGRRWPLPGGSWAIPAGTRPWGSSAKHPTKFPHWVFSSQHWLVFPRLPPPPPCPADPCLWRHLSAPRPRALPSLSQSDSRMAPASPAAQVPPAQIPLAPRVRVLPATFITDFEAAFP